MEGGVEGTEAGRLIHLILIAGDPVYFHAVNVKFVHLQDTVRMIVRRVGNFEICVVDWKCKFFEFI